MIKKIKIDKMIKLNKTNNNIYIYIVFFIFILNNLNFLI